MKILMIISEAPPIRSGISRVAERLNTGLEARGYQADILSSKDIPRAEYGEIRLSSMPFSLSEIRKKAKEYDIIHLHGPVPTFSDIFLLRGLQALGSKRPRLVYTHHAPVDLRILPLQPLIKIYNIFQERLANLADHVVVTTPSYSKRLSRFVPAEKLSVIPWGVDFERFAASPYKDLPFTATYLGQVRPYKGLPVLLDAAKGLGDSRVWVIGDGHASKEYRAKAQHKNLDHVKFWGQVSDGRMTELLQRSHVIVLPSVTHSEAFGIALLEGMAAGMVPVASHLPGVADLVGNEGITFPPGDSRSLHEILQRLKNDASLRIHLAHLAQAKAKLYSWDRVVFGYDRIFNRLVSPSIQTPVKISLPADAIFSYDAD